LVYVKIISPQAITSKPFILLSLFSKVYLYICNIKILLL